MIEPKITPPSELVRHWSRFQGDTDPEALWFRIANEAAQWGADQELEACCALMDDWGLDGEDLMECRRPKPPSLKEQALAQLDLMTQRAYACNFAGFQADAIRRALEALPDD